MATQQEIQDFELPEAASDAVREALPRSANGGDGALATGLGWFSMGLGIAEVAAPGLVARLIGVEDDDDSRELLRAAGMREMASGIGLLTRQRRTGWMWARVGGDVVDLAMLGSAFRSEPVQRNRLIAATAAVAGVAALDVLCGTRLSRSGEDTEPWAHLVKAITINRRAEDLYAFWRNFENLPRFMRHLESVRSAGGRRSHWVAKAPAGMTVEWDAELVDDRPNELIAWRSLRNADVDNSGSVRFRPAPGGQGTEVLVELRYDPPGGSAGDALAMLFGEAPEQQLHDDLRRFKQVMETGEIARSEASEGVLGMSRPGQPGPMEPYAEFEKGER